MKLILGQRFLNKWTPAGMGHKWNLSKLNAFVSQIDRLSNGIGVSFQKVTFQIRRYHFHPSLSQISSKRSFLGCVVVQKVFHYASFFFNHTEFRFILDLGTIIIFFNKVIIFRITYNSNKTRKHTKKLVFSWFHPYHICLRYRTNDDDPLFLQIFFLQKSDTVGIQCSFFPCSDPFFILFEFRNDKFRRKNPSNYYEIVRCLLLLCFLSSVVPLPNSFETLAYLSLYFVQTKKM